MTQPDSLMGPAAQAALAWAHSARFLVTASRVNQLPEPGLPEIAFVGRSNAGKSTAINALAHHKRLAFASKTPGRTQHINLFNVGPADAPDAIWVDLPGYGYAAVERASKQRWQAVVADYLVERRSLAGLVLLVDARHGFTALDRHRRDVVFGALGAGPRRRGADASHLGSQPLDLNGRAGLAALRRSLLDVAPAQPLLAHPNSVGPGSRAT
jgi:GTP-binding protein